MDKILCYSCSIARNKINAVKSNLIPTINLMLCETCLASGYEPRWAIVIAGRQSGFGLGALGAALDFGGLDFSDNRNRPGQLVGLL